MADATEESGNDASTDSSARPHSTALLWAVPRVAKVEVEESILVVHDVNGSLGVVKGDPTPVFKIGLG